jgi:hypothetical protein
MVLVLETVDLSYSVSGLALKVLVLELVDVPTLYQVWSG